MPPLAPPPLKETLYMLCKGRGGGGGWDVCLCYWVGLLSFFALSASVLHTCTFMYIPSLSSPVHQVEMLCDLYAGFGLAFLSIS